MTELAYGSGFGNHFETESVRGALPHGRNTPQRAPLGLYAEQLSGSAFTAPNSENVRSWLYRILPSVVHGPYRRIPSKGLKSGPFCEVPAPPDQLRWDPIAVGKEPADFVDGLVTICGAGDPHQRTGSF
jgi:homogentisate 1,2-dioxygenase